MKKNDRILRMIMSLLLVVSMLLLAQEAAGLKAEVVWKSYAKELLGVKPYRIVIDPGHGGMDPGKVGVTGCYEKDINLMIAEKLKSFLELEGIEVFLVRDGDYGLYEETDSNKKSVDMRNRVNFIEEKNPDLAISIHQNSYPDGRIKGAQTFYHLSSLESKELAEKIQDRLVETLDKNNHRKAKRNDSYHLLKNTTCPMVIVESGFLSNEAECGLLETQNYQEKVAWAIYIGIMQYLNSK